MTLRTNFVVGFDKGGCLDVKIMKFLLILAVLSLVESPGWCHSIEKQYNNDLSQENNKSEQDVYEVKEQPSALSFTYPKQVRPTLREIVYYHAIERPYHEKSVVNEEGPDFDDTSRPFTNSHGYQFLDSDFDKDRAEVSVDQDSIADEAHNEDTKDAEKVDLIEVLHSEEPTIISKDDIDHEDEITHEDDAAPTTFIPNDEIITETNFPSTIAPERKKRDAVLIPEAPRLEELDLSSLPPYIRNMGNISLHESEEIAKEANDAPSLRTYGMELNGDTGYVWDNTRSEPGAMFDVESPHSNEKKLINKEEDISFHERTPSADENQQMEGDEINENLKVIRDRIQNVLAKVDDNIKDSNDTHSPRTYGMKLYGDSGHVWNDMWSDPGVSYDVQSPDSKLEKEENKEETTKQPNISDADIADHSEEEDAPIDHDHEENVDIVEDLIENEQFWKWLVDWTTVYMDELTHHIKQQIREEVTKQVRNIAESIKKEPNANKSDYDKKETEDEDNESDAKKDGINQENFDETNDSDKDTLKDSKTEDIAEIENSEPEVKDVKLIIDGKEIPIYTSDQNSENSENKDKLRHRKDKDNKKKPYLENNDKESIPVNVNAEHLYGNSIGNEKVTNIFIFYPNKENKDIISTIKPTTETSVMESPTNPSEENQKDIDSETTTSSSNDNLLLTETSTLGIIEDKKEEKDLSKENESNDNILKPEQTIDNSEKENEEDKINNSNEDANEQGEREESVKEDITNTDATEQI